MSLRVKAIGLFTDFGLLDSYQGEVKARLVTALSDCPVFDLMPGAPACNPRAAAYLLAAILAHLPRQLLIIAVVDPGVGSNRKALLLESDGYWLLGPDNGLLSQIFRQRGGRLWTIGWRPEQLSASFHGRDFFAPAAKRLLSGESLALASLDGSEISGADWPADLQQLIHIDGFGNLVTGVRYQAGIKEVVIAGRSLLKARSFHEVPPGALFWYQNAMGLVEIAANQARGVDLLQVAVGEPVQILESC